MSNPFKKASTTKPAASGGEFIQDGDYDFLIERLVMREGGFKGDSFVAEFRVERAAQTRADVKPNPVGSSCSRATVLSTDFAYQLMMAFMHQVGVATGDDLSEMSPDQVEEFLRYACGKDNPCRGVRITDRTYRTTTKKNLEIVAHKWSAVAQTDEEIAANRAKLDASEK